jgi:hypothetical protein
MRRLIGEPQRGTPGRVAMGWQKPQPCGQGFACLRVVKGLADKRVDAP